MALRILHLAPEQLSEVLDGLADPASERHAASCPRCQKELKELKQVVELTRGVYEEVAVPRDFRQKVLGRIQPQASGVGEKIGSWLDRVIAVLQPRVLAPIMACALCLALALAWLPRQAPLSSPRQTAKAQPASPKAVAAVPKAIQAAPSQAPVLAQAPAARPVAAPVQAAKPPVIAKAAPRAASSLPRYGLPDPYGNVASAGGLRGAAGTGAPAPVFKAAGDHPNPVESVVPTPTAGITLAGHSQVRNNVVRASKGEAAIVLFKLDLEGGVKVEVFSRLGQRVAVLVDKTYPAGVSQLRWDGRDASGVNQASGIYQIRVQARGWVEIHKVLIVR